MEKKNLEIIERAKQGDEEAFLQLYDRYYKQAFYYALKLCQGNEADAYDATQEAFSTIHTKIQYLRSPEYFVSWMSKIVLSKCTMIFRKQKELTLDFETLDSLPHKEYHTAYLPEVSLHKQTDIEIFHSLIQQLSSKLQEVVQLIYIEQKTIKEASQILQIPEGTVKSRMNQARIQLKTIIKKYEIEEGRKIDFKTEGILPMSMFAKCITNIKQNVVTLGYLQICTVASLAFTCVIALHVVTQNKQTTSISQNLAQMQFPSISYNGKQITSYKSAYFTLMEWGANDVEIQKRSQEEKYAIQEIVSIVKNSDSIYKNMLKKQNWFEFYEDL